MQFSDAQMHALSTAGKESFARHLAVRIVQRFPDFVTRHELDDAALLQATRRIIELAIANDIRLQSDVRTLADCMVMLESSLINDRRYPWAAKIFARADFSGSQKVSMIHDYVVFPIA